MGNFDGTVEAFGSVATLVNNVGWDKAHDDPLDVPVEEMAGERFVVEMQKAKIHFFKDRSLFYVTFPIRDQAKKGDWSFKLDPIYFVAILDFEYDEAEEQRKFRRDVALRDRDGELFFDKLHFKFEVVTTLQPDRG